MQPAVPLLLFLLPVVAFHVFPNDAAGIIKQPLDPGEFDMLPNTVPALPVVQPQNATCRLDLSSELFGGVADACSVGAGSSQLDRGRCCPVLAAWLFAAHARSALAVPPPLQPSLAGGADGGDQPMVPYDNQRCVDALQAALEKRGVRLPRPNATCDAVICFCGIRLHQIGSLRCPAAFTLPSPSSGTYLTEAKNATPTAAVKELENSCRNASYSGCTRCVQSLQKLKGSGLGGDRVGKMMGRDCQLMGLTWLLARNKTAYIATVSAVLRALLYSPHSVSGNVSTGVVPNCSPDQENMPLAVDSLQFQHAAIPATAAGSSLVSASVLVQLVLFLVASYF